MKVILKLVLGGILVLTGAIGIKAEAGQSKFIAVPFQSKILVTNGKLSYVLDPEYIQSVIDKNSWAAVKIYSTNLWLLVKKSGEIKVYDGMLKNTVYYVLAPRKDLLSNPKGHVDYRTYAEVAANSNSVVYPQSFCTDCASSTHLDKMGQQVASDFVAINGQQDHLVVTQ